jgi:hypothetical protein
MARHRHRQHATPTTLQAHLDRLRQEFPNIRPFEEEDDINWWNDGLAALNANRLLLAERFFKKLTLAQPEHFDGYYGLAIVYHRRHRLGMTEVLLFCFPGRRVRPDRVVPTWQDSAGAQVDLSLLRRSNLETSLIIGLVQVGATLQPGFGTCRSDEFQDSFIAHERLSRPV